MEKSRSNMTGLVSTDVYSHQNALRGESELRTAQ